MTYKQIDPKKPIRQENGRAARILAADLLDEEYPLAVAIINEFGNELVYAFNLNGKPLTYFPNLNEINIENVPKKITKWINIYQNNAFLPILWDNKEDADAGSSQKRIACVKIEFEEGEGL